MTNRKTAKRKLASSYTSIPNPLLRSPGLPPLERIVAATLVSHDGPRGCYPSQETLAAEVGVSKRHVRRTLDILEGRGLIRIMGPTRERGSNRYDLSAIYAMTDPIVDPTGHPRPVADRTPVSSRVPTRPDISDKPTGHVGPADRTPVSSNNKQIDCFAAASPLLRSHKEQNDNPETRPDGEVDLDCENASRASTGADRETSIGLVAFGSSASVEAERLSEIVYSVAASFEPDDALALTASSGSSALSALSSV